MSGYERFLSDCTLPDPDDQLQRFGIVAQHPDAFVRNLLQLDRVTVQAAVRAVRARLKNPPFSAIQLLDRLRDHGLVASAAELRREIEMI